MVHQLESVKARHTRKTDLHAFLQCVFTHSCSKSKSCNTAFRLTHDENAFIMSFLRSYLSIEIASTFELKTDPAHSPILGELNVVLNIQVLKGIFIFRCIITIVWFVLITDCILT